MRSIFISCVNVFRFKKMNSHIRRMEHDQIDRQELYVKDLISFKMGTIKIESVRDVLTLKALKLPGCGSPDVGLFIMTRAK